MCNAGAADVGRLTDIWSRIQPPAPLFWSTSTVMGLGGVHWTWAYWISMRPPAMGAIYRQAGAGSLRCVCRVVGAVGRQAVPLSCRPGTAVMQVQAVLGAAISRLT